MANEKRLIDANKAQAVLVNMAEHLLEAGNPEMAGAVGYAAEVIMKQKTVDAVEVVHGRWVKQWCDNNMIGHEYAECSICGCSMLDTNQFWNSKHCPNCGAKMDGDGNADNH